MAANWTRVGFFADPRAHGRRARRRRSRTPGRPADRRGAGLRPRRRARRRCRARPSSPPRCRWPSTSCRWWRCSAASPRARRSCAAPRSCASRSPTASPPWSTGLRGLGADDRGDRRTASWSRAPAGCAAASCDAHGDHRLAMLGAVAGLASREGVEVVGMEAAAVSYPGFAAIWARSPVARSRESAAGIATGRGGDSANRGGRLPASSRPPALILAAMVIAIDGPAGAGKSSVARAVAERLGFTYLDTGAMYRCVALAAATAPSRPRRSPSACDDRARPRPRAARRPRRHRGDPRRPR